MTRKCLEKDGSHAKPCRLVAVSGSVQLLSAVAALEEHAKNDDPNTRPGLVLGIQPLHTASSDRARCMDEVIHQCAAALHKWDAIIDLRDDGIPLEQQGWAPIEIFVHMIEIPEARRLFERWPLASRVLYGDGLGLAHTVLDFIAAPSFRSEVRRFLSRFVPSWRRPADDYGTAPCDFTYALAKDPDYPLRCPNIHLLEPARYRELFQRLENNLTSPWLRDSLERIPSGTACDVLLMTNLPGCPATDPREEMQGYVQLLTAGRAARPDVVLVKPHPRNSNSSLALLEQQLSKFYAKVVTLASHEEAALPFELVLLKAFETGRLDHRNVTVFATSSAAVSLPVVFGLPVTVGFGKKACKAIYTDRLWMKSRLRHERKLKVLITDLLALVSEGTSKSIGHGKQSRSWLLKAR